MKTLISTGHILEGDTELVAHHAHQSHVILSPARVCATHGASSKLEMCRISRHCLNVAPCVASYYLQPKTEQWVNVSFHASIKMTLSHCHGHDLSSREVRITMVLEIGYVTVRIRVSLRRLRGYQPKRSQEFTWVLSWKLSLVLCPIISKNEVMPHRAFLCLPI